MCETCNIEFCTRLFTDDIYFYFTYDNHSMTDRRFNESDHNDDDIIFSLFFFMYEKKYNNNNNNNNLTVQLKYV